ncbi:hypothetical protein PISMIDRAFT_240858 [Pisolithus microcarpus 441]|uniref:Uncharacterized protein n=1 Tax=Pisolithus microcarpus 441 TaxID=765257 RepID=A0A0D0A3K5_9AGAM|nr:hypothetical protein BKA83DRAFT_240858 [Pisolithus microcarpus]KIK26628.1 hypothetical protein PISMIDRAFT_240858 [Pisolithus microcarpus 441]
MTVALSDAGRQPTASSVRRSITSSMVRHPSPKRKLPWPHDVQRSSRHDLHTPPDHVRAAFYTNRSRKSFTVRSSTPYSGESCLSVGAFFLWTSGFLPERMTGLPYRGMSLVENGNGSKAKLIFRFCTLFYVIPLRHVRNAAIKHQFEVRTAQATHPP